MNAHPYPELERYGLRSEKIMPQHLERLAVVYVRQSTVQQVFNHQESTRLQYSLVEQAVALGWPAARVLVIDEDLGKSGTSRGVCAVAIFAQTRPGGIQR